MNFNEITFEDIKRAGDVLSGVSKKTDFIYSNICDGCDVYLKLENLQRTGSFKIRGAYNKIYNLNAEERVKGVIASSAGNHAQGVALAASIFGIRSIVVMPETAPLSKISAAKNYGAEVILYGNVYDDAYARAVDIKQKTGAQFIHPFDDPHIISGQGTVGLEIMAQIPGTDVIIVPIGGGGLISGIALAAKKIKPGIKIIGVESAAAASMKKSLQIGRPTSLKSAATIADGIAVKTPGELTYQITSRYVDEIITVDEDEIIMAVLFLLEKFKVVSEGAGAVSMAALINGKVDFPGKKIVAVISGGNIDISVLGRVVDKGLAKAGRKTELSTIILDKPGSLQDIIKIISDQGANIVEIYYNRISLEAELGYARVNMVIETQNSEHLEQIIKKLHEKCFKIQY
ncbi:MAG: threonine ammonia-lyase [Desulfotomaculum sp.]|nr:threonine ammonia-lyase [Desulfotomaculum sp.]